MIRKDNHPSFPPIDPRQSRDKSAFQAPEDRYRVLVENSPDVIMNLDRDGTILFINHTLPQYTVEGVIGTKVPTYLSAEAGARYLHHLEKMFESGAPQTLELEAAGPTLWLTRIFPIRQEGKVASALVIATDITEQKRIEKALLESNELNRQIVETVPSGIVQVDASGAIRLANRQAQEILGLRFDELTRLYISDFNAKTIWEDGTPCESKDYPVSRCLATGAPQPGAIIGVERPDGTTVWAIFSAMPMRDPNTGDLSGAVVTFLDITERRRVEEELRESKRVLSTLIENLPGTVYRCRNDQDWTMAFISEGCFRLTGYAPSDFIDSKNISFGRLIHPEDRQHVWDDVQNALREKRSYKLVYRILTSSGKEKWVWEQGLGIFSPEGELLALEGLILDITEAKRAEEALQDSRQQLRDLSTRLQKVLEEERTRISREIHDQLGQQLTILKMELSWLYKKLSKDQQLLRDRTKSMAKLVDTTLETIRKISTEMRPWILDDLGLIAAMEWQIEDIEKKTGMRCQFIARPDDMTLDPGLSTTVFRILQETLTNIVRHAKADEIKIRLEKSEDRLALEVSDNGKGITPGQIANSKSLGLLGIRERALLWGGTVEINGTPNKGTTVLIEIPLNVSMDGDRRS